MNETNDNTEIAILPFTPQWQAPARALILAGLEEHLGPLDPSMNPDVNDIEASFANGVFLLAVRDGELIGAGAIQPEGEGTMRVVRMSVARDERRKGIGEIILQALVQQARQRGCETLVCETTDTWSDAIGFYRKHGFTPIGHVDGEVHFMRDIRGEA